MQGIFDRTFNPTRFQGLLRGNLQNISRDAFAGSDDALGDILGRRNIANISRDELQGTLGKTLFDPARLAAQKQLDEFQKFNNEGASRSGGRFGSARIRGNRELQRDIGREQTTAFAQQIGQLEQFRLGANQAAEIEANRLQAAGVQLARQREQQPFNLNALAMQGEDFFRQLRQQRLGAELQSRLPQFNPLLGNALQFASTPTQQIVQVEPGGFTSQFGIGAFKGTEGLFGSSSSGS